MTDETEPNEIEESKEEPILALSEGEDDDIHAKCDGKIERRGIVSGSKLGNCLAEEKANCREARRAHIFIGRRNVDSAGSVCQIWKHCHLRSRASAW